MKGVDVENGTWSEGMKLSLNIGQGHELLQRQERDHVIPWVIHFNEANSSCIVSKTKGALRHMHLISKKYLTEKLRGMIGAAGKLDCSSAHIHLRESDKSEDKAKGETSVESSIPCSHEGRALVMKEAEEMENAETNSKYEDKAEG
ncbi:hypothetical protein GW17_00021833 [Ensete ventricosum]|nr:hypothetical protein GW17_00021833 [Ensete ventricosum]